MQLKGWSICSGFGWSVCRGFAWSAWREFRWSVSADFPMKGIFSLMFLVLINSTYGQNRTNVWELGYSSVTYAPNSEMRYISGEMDTNSVIRIIPVSNTDVSICDTSGNLLFYSNGLTIGNRIHDTLQNAYNFNPGYYSDWSYPEGLLSCQGALILPYPWFEKKYILFHESGELFGNQVQPLQLRYSVINMNLDNGYGGIVDTLKNKYAVEDTLTLGGINAVKHANGRDWWVLVHNYSEAKYHKVLVSPKGIQEVSEQYIGSVINSDALVQSCFSPDGSKYCLATWSGIFEYLNFDRCTGKLSNLVTSFVTDSAALTGCSFSPDSRFLYVSTFYNLYQFDTWSNNLIDDSIHIAAWDSFTSVYGIPVLFFQHQLAPDGKIYMSSWNSSKYFHVITEPDSLAEACKFEQHSYVLPHEYNVSIPTFPNYDLGALGGSPCDTIVDVPTGIINIKNYNFRIAPNPVHDWLNIVYQSNDDVLLEIFDINGKPMATASLYHYFKNRLVDVSNLAAGVYLISITKNGKLLWSERMIVQK